jgi:hypothetical protein
VGGLIGRVGYNGKPFPIGNARAPIVMPKGGKLFLGINDFIFSDNAGSFIVTISKPRNPGSAGLYGGSPMRHNRLAKRGSDRSRSQVGCALR